MKIVISVIGVLVVFSLISFAGSSVLASDLWQSNYGQHTELMQISMLFWGSMFFVVIIGVVYLWWIKAL